MFHLCETRLYMQNQSYLFFHLCSVVQMLCYAFKVSLNRCQSSVHIFYIYLQLSMKYNFSLPLKWQYRWHFKEHIVQEKER